MSHPDLVASHLGDEEAVATVNLSGEDVLVITPSRSLLYQSEGILSDESVTEYPHDLEGLAVSDGRRKTTIEFSYPIEDDKRLRVPKNRRDSVLHYLLAGIFHAKGITRSGESVRSVFQFNELTLVITSDRALTHVGARVWDSEYEAYPYEELTGLTFEEGNIATELVLYVEGRSQRIKVPKDRTEEVKRAITQAVLAYHDVDSIAAFNEEVGTHDEEAAEATGPGITFDEAVKPLRVDSSEEEADDEPAVDADSWPYAPEESADDSDGASVDTEALRSAITELEEAITQQRSILDAQEDALHQLAESLPED